MLNIDKYKEERIIYEGTRTIVYRAIRGINREPAIVKVLRNPHPSFNELVQFRNQYIITDHLEHPHIVRPIALERCGNGYALVMPDDGAIALWDYWQESDRSLGEFLSIAIQISVALHYLSEQRIIHKDIKPTNILIHPETRQVQLIDFSIASLLPREQQQLINPNVLEGTLAYISPEQTGRMNRGIDYRTDFYSLGVTFFELLTGKLPFASSDPMELVHCHIAKMPPALANGELGIGNWELGIGNWELGKPIPVTPLPGGGKMGNGIAIPQAIENIVLKLMAKNAEERYQSALGLKHDLERCLQEWETTGEITTFVLGERDLCSRFLIPEKLYGREKEVQSLLAAFEGVAKGAIEMMLVAGFSGIGKTAVVSEVHKPIVEARGYFIKGKFDQFNRNIPLSAFVQAFRDLMGQLLGESDAQLANWKAKILSALGESGQVIVDVIPELELIVGSQPPVPELSGSAAQNRFNLLFQKFIAVLATPENPLTIFLDDLQWADSASLNLMKVLMGDRDTGYLLLLGAYRDNEVFPGHPLTLTLSELEKTEATISKIVLEPLVLDCINQLVAETLSCSEEVARPLAELTARKTQGNPFFATQFLKGLHQDELIKFNFNFGYWECELVKVRDAALTDDVVEFMAGRLALLPEATQNLLKLAACIGNQFELETLAVVAEASSEEVAADIWIALKEELIIPISEAYKFFQGDVEEAAANTITVSYRFLHDRVQQAAYSLIPEAAKQKTHLKIGYLLFNNIPPENQEEKIFDIVNQLNVGRELIADIAAKEELATLNLAAGRKAKKSTAYSAAVQYLNVAREMLVGDIWQKDYQLVLEIYTEATDAAYLSGDFEAMERLATIVLDRAKHVLNKVKIYEIKIVAKIVQTQVIEAIALGLDILKQLGTELPSQPTESDIGAKMAEITNNLQGKSIEELIELPVMTDGYRLGAMKILSTVWTAAYIGSPEMMPPMILEMVNLSLKYGNSAISAVGYSIHGLMLCGVFGDLDAGYKFGQLALKLLDKLNAREVEAKVLNIFGAFIQPWQEHLSNTLPVFREAVAKGLATGDLEYAGYSIVNVPYYSFFKGDNLRDLEAEMANSIEALKSINQQTVTIWLRTYWQAVLNLLGNAEEPTRFLGSAYNEEEMLPLHERTRDLTGTCNFHMCGLIVACLLENYEKALSHAREGEKYLGALTGLAHIPTFYFYDALTMLALCDRLSPTERDEFLQRVETNLEKMQNWASHAPMNYLHKWELMQAEKHRVLGKRFEAAEIYDRAIAGAKENEYVQEEALANELAAKFYLNWGKEKFAASYMQDAYYCYARWGAKAKIEQLEEKYPRLLLPILQQSQYRPSPSNPGITTQTLGTVTSNTSVLDLASAIKASQAISSEISLDALLSKLMGVVLENAGADKGALILNNEGNWVIAAICTNDSCQLSSDQTKSLPTSIINTVKRTLKTVLINQLEKETTFAGDPYLSQEQPLSLCCTPILHIGKLIGILYLENRAIADAFTPDRIEVLNLLTAQAAISIENARLYSRLSDYSHNLEAQVEQRTEELQEKNLDLQETLVQLQRTQAQLIQTEKMSSLGQMVAGIAHEINNPISFISGNVGHAREYFQDVLELLRLYEEEWPNASEAIEEKMEEINLEFLRSDLAKLFDSMKNGSDRIRNIVLGLRNFSRLDEADRKQADIHEGLENTLTIVQHRLKALGDRPEIAIVKNYGKLPLVNCYASQLNQVFLHILSNAIDVLSASYAGKSPEIRIATEMGDAQTIRIRIADNGPGMSARVCQKAFDPFFTTKPVGQGTGLGLSISYQIVTEQHGGQLHCISEPGVGTEFTLEIPV
ncbi:MAG: AAA family ATPase [Oscillatoria sp. SIO1A7]|nr:AAA family ATPase [Oscillatoria sp. SIO1A7]